MSSRVVIRRAAVLGAGVMGAQIAAHLANVNVPTLLFELPAREGDPNAIARKAIEGLRRLEPSPLALPARAAHIQPANYDQHLPLLRECELVIEAISERIDWKAELYARVAPHLGEHAVFASNTSGLSINRLADALPAEVRARFCGLHFFNPPRYMHLVELIPAAATMPNLLDALETFLLTTLGKGVVRAKDTPNFIANRVGVFSLLATIHHEIGNAARGRFGEKQKTVSRHRCIERRPELLPVREKLAQRTWVHYGAGQNMCAHLGAFFQHADADLHSAFGGELLEANRRGQSCRTGPHDHHVVLHRFAFRHWNSSLTDAIGREPAHDHHLVAASWSSTPGMLTLAVMRQDFAARGIPVKEDMPLPAEVFEAQAKRRVTLGLILAELVKAHQLQAKPEQVRAVVEEIAQSYENPPELVRWYYQSPERLREVESMVLEDNVVEWALKTAQVEDKPVPFDELMGNRQ